MLLVTGYPKEKSNYNERNTRKKYTMEEVFSLPFVIPSTVIRTFAFGRRKRSPANKPAQFSSFKKRKSYPRWQTCICYQTCERASREKRVTFTVKCYHPNMNTVKYGLYASPLKSIPPLVMGSSTCKQKNASDYNPPGYIALPNAQK